MRLGLNALFGCPPTPAQVAGFEARGVQAVRTELGGDPASMVAAFAGARCDPLYLVQVTGATHRARVADVLAQTTHLPPDAACELGNEWNLGTVGTVAMTAPEYAALANDTRDWFQSLRLRCYYGALSSCNPDAQALLSTVLHLCGPWVERVSMHRYPYRPDQQPSRTPYASRTEEMQSLADILRQDRATPRRLRITETGIRCGPALYRVGCLWWRRWVGVSEAQQLAYLRQERAYWQAGPCGPVLDGIDVYQENSGPGDLYGLNHPDGSPRVAWAWFHD